MNNNILFLKSVLYPYPPPKKEKALQTGGSSFFDLSCHMRFPPWKCQSSSISAGHRFPPHSEAWVPWDPGAWQVCTALLPSQTTGRGTCPSTDDPWRGHYLDHKTGTEEGRGVNSFPLCVQNHSNTRQAEGRFLVIHLRLRMFSSSRKVINCYLCESVLQGPGRN